VRASAARGAAKVPAARFPLTPNIAQALSGAVSSRQDDDVAFFAAGPTPIGGGAKFTMR